VTVSDTSKESPAAAPCHDGDVGMLAYEFQVTLPVVAKQTFHGAPRPTGSSPPPWVSARCSAAS